MDIEDIKNSILDLLVDSGISQHKKNMIMTLLPVMDKVNLNKVFSSLKKERNKKSQTHNKRERTVMKFLVMAEKLRNIKSKR